MYSVYVDNFSLFFPPTRDFYARIILLFLDVFLPPPLFSVKMSLIELFIFRGVGEDIIQLSGLGRTVALSFLREESDRHILLDGHFRGSAAPVSSFLGRVWWWWWWCACACAKTDLL